MGDNWFPIPPLFHHSNIPAVVESVRNSVTDRPVQGTGRHFSIFLELDYGYKLHSALDNTHQVGLTLIIGD